MHVDGDVPHGLHRIGVEGSTVGVGNGGELADGFDGADLVVRKHDRDQGGGGRGGESRGIAARGGSGVPGSRGESGSLDTACGGAFVGGECLFEILGVHEPLAINGQVRHLDSFPLERLAAVEDRMVLDGARDNPNGRSRSVEVPVALHGAA